MVQQALVTAEVAEKADWLPRLNVTVMDTLIGSALRLETKAGFCRCVLSQGTAIIDSISPLSFP